MSTRNIIAVATLASLTASGAFAESADPKRIADLLGCDNGLESYHWDADAGKARQNGITVEGQGGDLNIVKPGSYPNGEVFRGKTAFGIRGSDDPSIKAYRGYEGFNINLPKRNGYLASEWSDVEVANTLLTSDWDRVEVKDVSDFVGTVEGVVDGPSVSFLVEETSTGISEIDYYVCKENRRDESGSDNTPSISKPDVGNDGNAGGDKSDDTPSVGGGGNTSLEMFEPGWLTRNLA